MISSGYMVTLVHGTFARDALWTQDESALHRTLVERLDLPVDFKRFKWTGHNDHRARLKAGRCLRYFLLKLVRKHPSKLHFVIAHSHGGNVVLYALKDSFLRRHIAGVITMGTPFISCRSRNVAPALELLSTAVPVTSFLLMLTLVGYFLANYAGFSVGHYGLLGLLATWLAPPIIGLGFWVMFAIWFLPFVRKDAKIWVAKHQHRMLKLLNSRSFSEPNFLCAVIDRDEASGWLLSLRFASSLPNWSFLIVLKIWMTIRWPLVVFCLGALLLEGKSTIQKLPEWGALLVIAMTGVMLLAVLLQLFMLFVPLLVRSHKYGFGGESLYTNWLSDIRVDETPSGFRVDVCNVKLQKNSSSGLRHSSFYDNPHCLADICHWMNRRCFVKQGHQDISLDES